MIYDLSSVQSFLPAPEKKSRFQTFPSSSSYNTNILCGLSRSYSPPFRGECSKYFDPDRVFPSRKLRSLINDGAADARSPWRMFSTRNLLFLLPTILNIYRFTNTLGFRNEENLKIEGEKKSGLLEKGRVIYLILKREKDLYI